MKKSVATKHSVQKVKMIKDRFIMNELNIFKGIAIICVVLFHAYPPSPDAIAWYYIRDIIVLYQMPAFMLASGFLYGVSSTEIMSKSDYFAFIKKKFKRLMIPYLIVSLIILFIKYIGGFIATLQNPVNNNFWKYLIFNPGGGFANYLWFIYILFIIFLTLPLIKYVVRNSYILLFFFLLIYFVRIPTYYYFNLDYLTQHYIYFYLGCLYSRSDYIKINTRSNYLSVIFIMAFIIEYIAFKLFGTSSSIFVSSIRKLSLGIFGVFSFYFLSILLSNKKNTLSKIIGYLGSSSSAIYLLHTIPMGIVSICLLQYLKLSKDLLPIVVTLIFIAGIVIPILICKYLLNKNRTISLLILGKQQDI